MTQRNIAANSGVRLLLAATFVCALADFHGSLDVAAWRRLPDRSRGDTPVVAAGLALARPSSVVNRASFMAGGGAFQVQAEFYVSPTGNDANAGTETAPFRTIERARTAVRTLTSGMTGDIVVYLRGGVHTLANTVTFSTQDSGQNGFQVIYAAYPGETPMLSGGQRITNWVPSGGNLYKAAVGTLRFRQLYVNGKRAIRARTPDAGSYYEVRNWDIGGRRIEVAKDEIGNWQRRNQAELVILGAGVNQSNLRVGGVSTSGNSAFITPLEPERTRIFQQVYPPKSQYRPFYFENAFELLDSPGEWYLNTDTNEVYYWPLAGQNPSVAEVVAPRLEQLVSVVGTLNAPVHDLQFRGLTFEHTTWLVPSSEGYVGDQASIVFTQPLPDDEISSYPGHRLPAGVHAEAANTIRFERNVFRHMGASALNLYRAVNDAVVVGNVILDVSASGISVDLNLQGNPSDQRVISRRTRLTNNYIAETGRDYYQSVGIMLGYTDAAVVEHNELQDMPYSGISVGWGWDNVDSALRDNVIRYNRIQRVLNFMSDGGGIYTLSKQPGTLIAENYVRDIVRTSVQGGFNISGIYLDEGSSQITVRDNVLVNTGDRGLFQNGNGPGNTLINNGGTSPAVISNAGLEPAYADIRPTPLQPPSRANGQPSGTLPAGTTQATLSLATNEIATCRYGVVPGVAYGNLPFAFTATGGTSHATLVTGLVDGGSYTFYVRCQDLAGNANPDDWTIAFAVGVVVPADTTKPGVTVTAPGAGATVSGSVTVTATASDNVGVVGVQFLVNGSALGAEDTTAPYSAGWTTTSVPNGVYQLTARARDAAGNQTTSAGVTVTVANAATPGGGLVAAYSFNEGTGGTLTDRTGLGHTGTLSGAAWTTQGRFGGALSFDGVNDWVTIGDANDLDVTTGLTVEAWVYPTALGATTWREVVIKERPGGEVFNLYANGDTGRPVIYVARAAQPDPPQGAGGTSQLAVNTWTHLAATYDGTTLRLYVNGTQVGTQAAAGPLLTSSGVVRLGGNGLWGEFFQGRIDEVRLYNRALTATELQADMTTPVDTIPPVRSGRQPTGTLAAGTTQATLSLTTDETAACRYGPVAGVAYASQPTVFTTTNATTHTTLVTGLTNGSSYSYYVRCADTTGNANPDDFIIAFAVAVPADTTGPGVTVTAPGAGATVSGSVTVTATASDNVGVVGVQFLVNGSALGAEDTTAPYSVGWTTTSVPNGVYQLTARARDAAGNQTTSAGVTVTVANAATPGGGLVAAYSFNEGTGGTLTDRTGLGHTGTLSGAAWTTQGRFGGALSFDGVNDWVTIGDANDLDVTTGLTVEAWVYPTALGATTWREVVIKERPGGEVFNLYANGDTGRPVINVARAAQPDPPQGAGGTSQLAVNTWTHLAATYDGTTLRLYVNGTQVGTQPVAGPLLTSSGVVRLGGNGVWGEFFQGRIDEVRLYNRALTATELQADMTTPVDPGGLVAAYSFNEGTGGTLTDRTGLGHTGTLSGAAWTTQGRFGGALSFDGVNDWVTIGDANDLDVTTGLTVEAWVYPTALGATTWREVVIKERPGGEVFNLYANGDTGRPVIYVARAAQPDPPQGAGGTSQLAVNTWTHLAATYDGTTLRLYVNGTQVGTQAAAGPLLTSSGVVRLGGNGLWGEFFQGRIDEVRLYNRALTATELQADMTTPVAP